MVNLALSKMRGGGVPFYYENRSIYHRTLSLNDVSSKWMARPVLFLNGVIVCLFMIKQAKNKSKAVWLSLLLMVLVILIVYPGLIRYLGK